MELTRVQVPVSTSGPGNTTNAYLVGTAEPVLIDPAARVEQLTDEIRARGLAHVVVTHTHPDHVGGVRYYCDHFGGKAWAHRTRQDRFEQATGVRPDRTFRANTSIGPVDVIETPGHAPDHVAFCAGDTAYVGDLAFANSSVFIGPPDGDMRAYLISLRRLLVRGFTELYPGHGVVIEDPTRRLTQLIAHRLDRESRVLRAVQAGATTPTEIVSLAYEGEDLTGVERLARLAVEAHLEKLDVQGVVNWDGAIAEPA